MSKTFVSGILSVVALAAVVSAGCAPQEKVTENRNVTPAQFEEWKKDLNNWGRWGKDDEIGTMNLITPAKRKEAAALVKEGFSVLPVGDAKTVKAVDNP